MIYSAIIVLGNLMSKYGELNNESKGRMDLAIDHFYNGNASRIVTCGWPYRKDSNIAICDAMRQYAIKIRDVPSDAIITTAKSRDTVGDAVFSKRLLKSKNDESNFLIVTSDYHVSRTSEIFSFIYGRQYRLKVVGSPTEQTKNLIDSEKRSLIVFRNTFYGIIPGDDESIYQRLCEDHPFYNGVSHPKI